MGSGYRGKLTVSQDNARILLATGSLLLFFLLEYLSWEFVGARVVFNLLGPLMAFSFVIFISLWLLKIPAFDGQTRDMFLFGLLMAILGIFFALTINTRSSLIAISLLGVGVLNLEQAIFLLVAIFAPIIEEFVKIYPALLLSVHFKEKNGRTVRYISNPQYFLILAIIGGGVFNLLETYLYTWSASLENIEVQEEWRFLNFQLLLRSVNPLHVASTLISALGIIVAMQSSDNSAMTRNEFKIFFPYFLGAVLLHGLWNGSSILFSDQTLYYNLPLVNWLLIPVSITIWIAIMLRYRRLEITECEVCMQWHLPNFSHTVDPRLDQGMISLSFTNFDNSHVCSNCKNPKPGLDCEHCGATEVFACSNCQYPLPIFGTKCWKCNQTVESVVDELTRLDTPATEKFFKSMYLFISITYVMQLLIDLTRFFSDTCNLDKLPVQFVLFFVISGALLGGVYLNTSTKYRLWGIAVAKYLFAQVLLLIAMLLIFVGIIFTVSLPASAIFLFIVALVYLYIFFKVIYPSKIFMGVIS